MNYKSMPGSVILQTLNAAGYEAYYVGGCVRDICLNKVPKDYDITTNALPDTVEALFENTIPTGKAYGTITVMIEAEAFEVTTYRLESDYDGRRPRAVAFAQTLVEDLSRRDFTMNAMAMDLSGHIQDPFNGQGDLKSGVLRFVGDPLERIREDKIRILRYIRFLCQYNLKPFDEKLLKSDVLDLGQLSAERIREEFNKILLSDCPEVGIKMLEEMGVLKQFFPELSACNGFIQHHPAHNEDVFNHTLSVLALCENNLMLRLSALCHDLGKIETLTFDEKGIGHFYGHQKNSAALAENMMRRLKYANKEIELVTTLVSFHMRIYEHVSKASAKRLLNQLPSEALEILFLLQLADTKACAGDRSEGIRQIEDMRLMCRTLLEVNEAFSIKDLAVNGHDLMQIGINGPLIGQRLNELLEAVISEQCLNEKTALLDWLFQLK